MTEVYELASLNVDNGRWRAVLRYKGSPYRVVNPDLTMLFTAENEKAARQYVEDFLERQRRRAQLEEQIFYPGHAA